MNTSDETSTETDPITLGWMQGAPPPKDKLVRHADMSHFQFPRTRWSFAHMRQLVPTTNVWRGRGGTSALPNSPHHLQAELDAVRFTPLGHHQPMSWAQSLALNHTDAICVLHQGQVVYERYFGVMRPEQPHMGMSITKSYTGLLAEVLVHEGRLDPNWTVPHLVPELRSTAFDTATVRQVMDMRTGVAFSEDYARADAQVWQHARAGGIFPRAAGDGGPQSFFDFLKTLHPEGAHGQHFQYKTVNTDVLGWILRRVTGLSFGALLSQRLWQPLGCEEDGSLMVDTEGTEFAGGGLSATVRDLARLGECLRNDGHFNGRQVVPAAVVHSIRHAGASPELVQAFTTYGPPTLPGGAYRSMWWMTNNPHGAWMARGIHGQALYIDPVAQVVVARFASHPQAANVHLDPTSLPAYHALGLHLIN